MLFSRVFRGGFIAGTLSTIAVYTVYKKSVDADVHIEYEEGKNKVDPESISRGSEILKYGVPDQGSHMRYYANHALVYDQANKRPLWVAEHITKQHIKGSANRKLSKFRPDPDVPFMFSASNEDYWKSGWSRGHMAAAGNHKHHQQAMDDTFSLANILPQDLNNNSGFWNRFEIYCRDLTKKYADVRVISGPLVLPNHSENGKLFVKYEVIGKKQVPVPSHLFKVIIAENEGQTKALGAFVVPNIPIKTKENELLQYQVPVEFIEEKSGLTFFQDLDRKEVRDLCTDTQCTLMDESKFELYFIGRRLESARTLAQLDKVWAELKTKDLKPDKFLLDLYSSRQHELSIKKSEL